MFIKKYISYIILIIVIGFLGYRLFFNTSPAVKLLKEELKEIKIVKDSLDNEISGRDQTIKLLKYKSNKATSENRDLKIKLLSKENLINNKIITNEENINNINDIDDEYADDYISNYKYSPLTEKGSD